MLDYFADVSDGLIVADPDARERHPGATWGMVAAVLGNAANRQAFASRFWWADKQIEAPGENPARRKPKNPFVPFPEALDAEIAAGAIKPWAAAVADYSSARDAAAAAIALRQRQADQVRRLARTAALLSTLECQLRILEAALEADEARSRTAHLAKVQAVQARDQATRELNAVDDYRLAEDELVQIEAVMADHDPTAREAAWQRARQRHQDVQATLSTLRQELDDLQRLEPSFLWRIVWPMKYAAWQRRLERARTAAEACGRADAVAAAETARTETLLSDAQDWNRRHALAKAAYATARRQISRMWDAVPGLEDLRARRDAAERSSQQTDGEANAAALALALTRRRLADRRATAARLRRWRTEAEQTLRRLGLSPQKPDEPGAGAADERTEQLEAPWHDEAVWTLRHRAFAAALELHKSFIAANRAAVIGNLEAMVAVLTGQLWRYQLSPERLRAAWNTLFLAIPVVSTTFASLGRLFDRLDRESIGWLVIDEAGQATPQAAVGGIWRARRTVVVGDPMQIEPVVTVPHEAIDMLRERCRVDGQWHPIRCSAQVLADRANPLGTELHGRWVGSPLRVHRRCLPPMFDVANAIAYDNMMIYGTDPKDAPWLGKSCWIDVPASDARGHWIPAQGNMAARIVLRIAEVAGLHRPDNAANVYVISPFKRVGQEMRRLLLNTREIRDALRVRCGDDEDEVNRLVGTVHTFQGKEAPVVVLLLGGDPTRPGAITRYAAGSPNILNVALTRARTRIYVIGDYRQWSTAPQFSVLAKALEATGSAPVGGEAFALRAGLSPALAESAAV
jgi:hypothetical protein